MSMHLARDWEAVGRACMEVLEIIPFLSISRVVYLFSNHDSCQIAQSKLSQGPIEQITFHLNAEAHTDRIQVHQTANTGENIISSRALDSGDWVDSECLAHEIALLEPDLES